MVKWKLNRVAPIIGTEKQSEARKYLMQDFEDDPLSFGIRHLRRSLSSIVREGIQAKLSLRKMPLQIERDAQTDDQ